MTMTDEQIRQAARQWLDQALAEEYEDRLQSRSNQTPDGLTQRMNVYSSAYSEIMEAVELKRYPADLVALAKEIFHSFDPADVGPHDLQFKKLCDALALAKAALCESATATPFTGQLAQQEQWKVSAVQMVNAQGAAPADQQQQHVEAIQQALKEVLPTLVVSAAGGGGVHGAAAVKATVSAAVEAYISAKGPTFAQSSTRNIFNNVRQFAAAVKDLKKGKDILIMTLDRQTMRDFSRIMAAQPANSKRKEYLGKSLLEIEQMEVPQDQRLSDKTLDTKFTMIKSFLNWCEMEYGIHAKPLNSAMTIPKAQRSVENKRRAFTTEELKLLFKPSSYVSNTDDKPSNFWVPIISLFTGMRLEEIAQLHVSDIRQDEGVWCFDINEQGNDGKHVKSEAGKRLVPIHSFLINDMCLLDFVQRVGATGEVRLFPELEREKKGNVGGAVTKWFSRYRRNLGVGEGKGKVSDVVFHSFRHTVVNHLLAVQGVAPRLVQKVVGHDLKGAADIGITANYEGKYPTATLRDEVVLKLAWADDLALLRSELLGLSKSRWSCGA